MTRENNFQFIKNLLDSARKYLFLISLPLSLTTICAAQQNDARKICALTLTDAPAFFGLKLEMTPIEVKNVFGKSLKLKVKREGTFFQNFIDKKPPAFLPNVRALYLRFFDRKLYQIEIFYNEMKQESAQIQAPTELVNRLSANLHLPEIAAWTAKDERFYKLNCAGFSLAADVVLNPRIELTDDAERARFEAARKSKK